MRLFASMVHALQQARFAWRRSWLGRICPAYLWWGIVLLLVLASGAKVLGQGYTKVLIEYRKQPGFWNRVAEFPNYYYPNGNRNEANFSVVGRVFAGDTLVSPEVLARLNTEPVPYYSSAGACEVRVDTAAGWKILQPAEEEGLWESLEVYPVYMTNRTQRPQTVQLTDEGQLPITVHDTEGNLLRTAALLPKAAGLPEYLTLAPGESLITLLHPIQNGPNGHLDRARLQVCWGTLQGEPQCTPFFTAYH